MSDDKGYEIENPMGFSGAGRPPVDPILEKMGTSIRALVTVPLRNMLLTGVYVHGLNQIDRRSDGISFYLRLALRNQLAKDGITRMPVRTRGKEVHFSLRSNTLEQLAQDAETKHIETVDVIVGISHEQIVFYQDREFLPLADRLAAVKQAEQALAQDLKARNWERLMDSATYIINGRVAVVELDEDRSLEDLQQIGLI